MKIQEIDIAVLVQLFIMDSVDMRCRVGLTILETLVAFESKLHLGRSGRRETARKKLLWLEHSIYIPSIPRLRAVPLPAYRSISALYETVRIQSYPIRRGVQDHIQTKLTACFHICSA